MKDTAILIPVHNRRAITLACLRRLAAQGVFEWATVVVLDDGSSDGTAEAVRAEFPAAEVRRGDGTWWWTGAIAAGMEHALAFGVTFIGWLNDDCAPAPGALRALRDLAEQRQAITGGVCVIPGSDVAVYGGLRRRGYAFDVLPRAAGRVESCDALSGNLVFFPTALARDVGAPDARRMPHAVGDIDFVLRAAGRGWPVLVAHDAVAEAVPNRWGNHASWLCSDISPWAICADAWRKHSYGYFPMQFAFFRRHWGWRGAAHAVLLLGKRPLIAVVRLVVPQCWIRRWWGTRSATWQAELRLRAATAQVREFSSPNVPGAD